MPMIAITTKSSTIVKPRDLMRWAFRGSIRTLAWGRAQRSRSTALRVRLVRYNITTLSCLSASRRGTAPSVMPVSVRFSSSSCVRSLRCASPRR